MVIQIWLQFQLFFLCEIRKPGQLSVFWQLRTKLSVNAGCVAVTLSCSEAPSVAGSREEQHMLCDTVAGAPLSADSLCYAGLSSPTPAIVTQPLFPPPLPPARLHPSAFAFVLSCRNKRRLPHLLSVSSHLLISACLYSDEGPGCPAGGACPLKTSVTTLMMALYSQLTFFKKRLTRPGGAPHGRFFEIRFLSPVTICMLPFPPVLLTFFQPEHLTQSC